MLEWDFIIASLHLFGFPSRFVAWIEECITSTSFLLSLNGELTGFFPRARGLRQGDPMSLYLFVIAMELLHLLLAQRVEQSKVFRYHWYCAEIGFVNLCFADDLLLFCRAEMQSVQLFRDSLMVFAEWSGFEANPSKSQLIVSKAAMDMKQALLGVLDFQEGTLPVKNLGVLLISSRLTAGDFSPLLRKIDERLKGWGKLQHSFAAWVQLLRVIETRMLKFLWHGNSDSGTAMVAGKDVCKLLEEGGTRP
ncbi:UNVERIFIED_CONTAM: hypothetical protein Slati_1509800 [Sesamum latifolium]|uniref:Reverse transcriptase domain-containing protein n=1 Tax=Sesamum latifolium TaxID=2727402 RepID=A0AAW2X8H0_9LAMI